MRNFGLTFGMLALLCGTAMAQTPTSTETFLPAPEGAPGESAGTVAETSVASERVVAPESNTTPTPGEESGLTSIDRILGTQNGAIPLSEQNLNPNDSLTGALRVQATVGPIFRMSDNPIFLSFEEGQNLNKEVRVLNIGDQPGFIRGINVLSPIEGLIVTDTCPDDAPLGLGDACTIAISFTSDTPREIFNILVISVEERDRTVIEVPLQITVTEKPFVPPPVDQNPPVDESPAIDPNDPRFGGAGLNQEPRPPTAEEIARAYFGGVGGIAPPESGPMAVVTMPDSMLPPVDPFLGGSSESLSVETIVQDPRYPDTIASTEASLPVDRDMILTADRVIKAVLDTPFSNVMCGKVVAIVESDVYSATSATPLIQAGSRVLGRCGTLVKERAGIVWERIITVDGRSISLAGEDSMTRDANGLGGALGRLYRTPFDRYILPLFGTFVDVGAGIATAQLGEDETQSVDESGNISNTTSARNEGLATATTAIQTRANETIREMQDVREVLVVPPGSRIDIEVFQDIYFKDERDVVRLADTVYDVSRPELSQAPVVSPDAIELVPFRPGLEGPVVVIDGRRFVVREGTAPVAQPEPGQPQQDPTAPGQPTRPGASTPTAPSGNGQPVRPDTQATLNDLQR